MPSQPSFAKDTGETEEASNISSGCTEQLSRKCFSCKFCSALLLGGGMKQRWGWEEEEEVESGWSFAFLRLSGENIWDAQPESSGESPQWCTWGTEGGKRPQVPGRKGPLPSLPPIATPLWELPFSAFFF